MTHFRLLSTVALVVLCQGCSGTKTTPATTQVAATQASPDAQCKSWGIQPDSPGYKQCVDGLKEAADADGSAPAGTEPMQANAAALRADMTRQRDDMRKQMDADMKAAASNPKCVTTTNGSNTSVSCPDSP